MSGELKKSVEEVKGELECGKNGRPYSTIENVAIVFREDALFAGKLRYNSFHERIKIIGELPWDRASPGGDGNGRCNSGILRIKE